MDASSGDGAAMRGRVRRARRTSGGRWFPERSREIKIYFMHPECTMKVNIRAHIEERGCPADFSPISRGKIVFSLYVLKSQIKYGV